MRILALDLGDRWVGTALSDALGITCKPYKTVTVPELHDFLRVVIPQERVTTVVIGYPKTFSGGQSDQTRKVVAVKEKLEQQFGTVNDVAIAWILWDERLSSKRAAELVQKARTPEEKQKSHSIAAAFILQNYLDHLALSRQEF
ncbi:MAG: Holliday junction resolvase RuvX [Candidatus Babeliales bacterium]|jgi:putative Holliday junction resolvase